MKKSKAIRDYPKFSDAELLKKSNAVSSGLTNNPAFPDAAAGVNAMNAGKQLFADAMANAKGRDSAKVAEKNVLRGALILQMDNLLHYVNNTAAGDRPKLLTTGFTISKESSAAGEPGEVKNFKVKLGKNSGEVLASVKKVDEAKYYEFQFGLSPVTNDEWKIASTTTCATKLVGLERGKEYDLRVAACGNKGVKSYSHVLTILVV